jgi:hypothetical protein
VPELLQVARPQVTRQVAHWSMAASRLRDLERLAAPGAWAGLERYLGVVLRRKLGEAIDRLQRQAEALQAQARAAETPAEVDAVARQLVIFRQRYLRVETLVDFYADAINTRTNPEVAALLRACDVMAQRGMAQLLEPLGKSAPPVLTYIDSGLGASILKAGLRLWDGRTESLVAAVKLTRHNLYRPTALIHEAGHQVAHIVGWNGELAARLEQGLEGGALGRIWGGWASEIAADAFAFVHTGYASVASLHDVLAGNAAAVFRFAPQDPHPVSYIRVLLGTAMCRESFGAGPWDGLAAAWSRSYRLESAHGAEVLLRECLPVLPRIAEIVLRAPMEAFAGRPLSALTDPARVAPPALVQLEQRAGQALYTSQEWIWAECLRLLALNGYQAAVAPERAEEILRRQEGWMLKLGASLQAGYPDQPPPNGQRV